MADDFVQKQENGDYTPSREKIEHVQETLQFLSVMTGDHRLEEVLNSGDNVDTEEGGVYSMCDVLDRVERRGEERVHRRVAEDMLEDSAPLGLIIKHSRLSEDAIRALAKSSGFQ